jgi:hypothetical protein
MKKASVNINLRFFFDYIYNRKFLKRLFRKDELFRSNVFLSLTNIAEVNMYNIEKKPYGFKLTFDGFIKLDEMTKWVEDSKSKLNSAGSKFGIFVDMRNLKPLAADVKSKMEEGQKLYKMKGMERSVVILNSAMTKMQFEKIAKESGIYQWERYINATDNPNWEKDGEAWLTSGTDPK